MIGRTDSELPSFSERIRVSGCETPERDELSEAETIRRAQRGDASAFERLYRLHSRRVHAVCLRMVADATEAEDLTQEAFLRVFRKIHTFRGASAFSTWLHRIALNVALMHLRRKNLQSVSLDDMTKTCPQERRENREMGGSGCLAIRGSGESGARTRAAELVVQDGVRTTRCRGLQAPRDCQDDRLFRRRLKGTASSSSNTAAESPEE